MIVKCSPIAHNTYRLEVPASLSIKHHFWSENKENVRNLPGGA